MSKTLKKNQIKELTESAESGDSDCQYQLGNLYYKSLVVKRCTKTAIEWMEKAAQQGHIKAQIELGSLFASAGYGVRDLDKAFYWSKKAAENENPEALYQLAFKYEAGQGTQQSSSKALSLYHKAAELGSTQAQMTLGDYYRDGNGVEIDQVKSFCWYERAAYSGETSYAQFLVGLMCLEGVGTKIDKTRAINWLRKSANAGHRDANYFLGYIYFKGDDVQQDISVALELLKKGASKGSTEAMELLGRIYLDNDMLSDAYKYLSESCSRGNQNSCELLESSSMSNYAENHLPVMKMHLGSLSDFLTDSDSRVLKEINLYFENASSYYKKYEGGSLADVLILALNRRKFMVSLDHKEEAHLALKALDKLTRGVLKRDDEFKVIVATYKKLGLSIGSCLDYNAEPSIFKFVSSLGLSLIGIDNGTDSYNLIILEKNRLPELLELAQQADIKILFNNHKE